MSETATAVLFVVAAWWLSTAAVLRLVWLGAHTHRRSVALSSVLALVGVGGVVATSGTATVASAYLGFLSALAVWAWHELTFLLGLVTGPRRLACPDGVRGWERFRLATATVIHHEVVLALTALALVVSTWDAPNQAGTWTFLVLWVMRLSAKLNVFLGVRNVSEEFVPLRLRYLLSYFRQARLNPLMPISLVVSGGFVVSLAASALSLTATDHVVTAHALVATLLALALLEHLFLALPVRDAVLWRWALRSTAPGGLREEV